MFSSKEGQSTGGTYLESLRPRKEQSVMVEKNASGREEGSRLIMHVGSARRTSLRDA